MYIMTNYKRKLNYREERQRNVRGYSFFLNFYRNKFDFITNLHYKINHLLLLYQILSDIEIPISYHYNTIFYTIFILTYFTVLYN